MLQIAARTGAALESVGAAYFLGGSVASSLQGDPRSTNDIDLVTDLAPGSVEPFAGALGPDFDVDTEALADALRRRSSWNIFFLPQFTRIDLFAKGPSPFDEVEFSRRQQLEVLPGTLIWVKTAEDSILRKLLWHRAGGQVSERQWRDVVSVLRVMAGRLDLDQLALWATRLGIKEQLDRAMKEASS